jgi:hypothetical protein
MDKFQIMIFPESLAIGRNIEDPVSNRTIPNVRNSKAEYRLDNSNIGNYLVFGGLEFMI